MPAPVTIQTPTYQATAIPNEVLMAAESQWLFTDQELLQSPSILNGLSPEKERENRSKGVNFIVQVGILLKLPQITLATASTFLHRFYMRHSMPSPSTPEGFHYYSIAATCLFLATKVEENCRKMKELVIACVRVAQKDPYKVVDEQDKEFWRWKDHILLNEDILLEALCFDLRLEAPYKVLYDILLRYGEDENKKLRNAAWAFISDSCLTTLRLLFPSRTIAGSALYAAARHSGVTFPDDQDARPWWDVVGVDLADIGRACNHMAEVYRGTPVKGARENNVYERSPDVMDGAYDITRAPRGLGRDLTPAESSPGSTKRAAADQPQSNGVDAFAIDTNGDAGMSPRKRQKISGFQGSELPDGAHAGDATPLPITVKENGMAKPPTTTSNDPRKTGPEGLQSPTIEGSEDGEV